MSSARQEILARIRGQLADRAPVERAAADERRAAIPARAQGGVDRIELFIRRAAAVGTSIGRASRLEEVPAEVARFAGEPAAGGPIPVSVAPRLCHLPWRAAGLDPTPHPPGPLDRLSVTAACAGIAETGTCAVPSGAENAHSASVLTRANVIVLETGAVMATMEEVFARTEALPRALLFVTGPSRTGDIGFRVVVPAQGPARVHIVLVGG